MEKWSKKEEFNKAWNMIIAKAWSDPVFKQRLIKEPQKVLKENGIELPSGIECKLVEDTDKIMHLRLPKKPEDMDVGEFLKALAAGKGTSCTGW